jgi:DNA mismatch endonuclease (patch repair protein)
MKTQAERDTLPERRVRTLLHAQGLRYRVHVPVPGVPRRSIDIAFPRAHVAVFVDGCFWHGCSRHKGMPLSNAAWWDAKIARNRERDRETDRLLSQQGWKVVRGWEHEPADRLARRVRAAVERATEDLDTAD